MCLSIASDGFNTGYVMRYGDSTAEEIIGVIAVHAAGGCDLEGLGSLGGIQCENAINFTIHQSAFL
jgi:hypothetical protein